MEEGFSSNSEKIIEMNLGKTCTIRLKATDLEEILEYHKDDLEKSPIFFGFLAKKWMDERNRKIELLPYSSKNIIVFIRFNLVRLLYWYLGMQVFQ